MPEFTFETLVSSKTKEGRVTVTVSEEGRESVSAQLDYDEAYTIGTGLVQAAESARVESMLIRFLMGDVGLDMGAAASVLQRFREMRKEPR